MMYKRTLIIIFIMIASTYFVAKKSNLNISYDPLIEDSDTIELDDSYDEKEYNVPTPRVVNGDFIIVKDGQTLILEGVFPKDFKSPESSFTGVIWSLILFSIDLAIVAISKASSSHPITMFSKSSVSA